MNIMTMELYTLYCWYSFFFDVCRPQSDHFMVKWLALMKWNDCWHIFPDLLSTVPGCNESVLFAKDGCTLLNESSQETQDVPEVKQDIEIRINLEQSREAVDSHAHLLGK